MRVIATFTVDDEWEHHAVADALNGRFPGADATVWRSEADYLADLGDLTVGSPCGCCGIECDEDGYCTYDLCPRQSKSGAGYGPPDVHDALYLYEMGGFEDAVARGIVFPPEAHTMVADRNERAERAWLKRKARNA